VRFGNNCNTSRNYTVRQNEGERPVILQRTLEKRGFCNND
jgi:hypothetical protein